MQNAQLFELAFRDAAGGLVPAAGGGALFDEQAAVPDAISQLNSMYFDEIYHGRTGYEQLHRMPVYETTHPPLGKDLIMLGIALFGMTGLRLAVLRYAVRCAAGAAGMVLCAPPDPQARGGGNGGCAAGAGLYALFPKPPGHDRHLRHLFHPAGRVLHAVVLPAGADGGVDSCPSADGAGRARLRPGLRGQVDRHLRGGRAGGALPGRAVGAPAAGQPGFWAEFRTAAVGGVLFYVVLPLCIYMASYLPYWWRHPSFSLGDWWQCQVSMYSYHATLKATHPFESRWYTWLLGLRPVWYYRNGNLPYGTKASIAGMAGPVIWVVGLAALVGLFWRQVSGRGSRQGAAVLILYGTQLIPWMLVTRCTFLYHYFPSSMFCLAALALVLARMRHRDWARRLCAGLCAAAAVLFAVYYPALSGLPIPAWWADALEVLPSFGFY